MELKDTCPEPDGNQEAVDFQGKPWGESQHDVAMRLVGHCPWCGEEADD